MNFCISRALAGVDSWTELGLVLRSGRHMRAWIDVGRPFPVSHAVKVRNILSAAQLYGLKTLVETGMQAGATLAATAGYFDRLRPSGRDAVIIDDARLFVGKDGYPPIERFMAAIKTAFGTEPRHADDAIFILPR